MTQIAGQNGAGWQDAPASSTTSAAVYYGPGYNALPGVFTTLRIGVGALNSATKATAYVYQGVGQGATFLAMSAEFDVTVMGTRVVPCFGTCARGPVTIIVQPSAGTLSLSVNGAGPSNVNNIMIGGIFPYRQPPPVLPAPTLANNGSEPLMILEGSLVSGTGVVIGPVGLADNEPFNSPALVLVSSGGMPLHQLLDPVNKLPLAVTLSTALMSSGLKAINVAANVVPAPT